MIVLPIRLNVYPGYSFRPFAWCKGKHDIIKLLTLNILCTVLRLFAQHYFLLD